MTNAVTYLSQVDQIVVLEEGEISDMGSYHELMAHNGHFTEFITTYLNEVEEDEKQFHDKSKLHVNNFMLKIKVHKL